MNGIKRVLFLFYVKGKGKAKDQKYKTPGTVHLDIITDVGYLWMPDGNFFLCNSNNC